MRKEIGSHNRQGFSLEQDRPDTDDAIASNLRKHDPEKVLNRHLMSGTGERRVDRIAYRKSFMVRSVAEDQVDATSMFSYADFEREFTEL